MLVRPLLAAVVLACGLSTVACGSSPTPTATALSAAPAPSSDAAAPPSSDAGADGPTGTDGTTGDQPAAPPTPAASGATGSGSTGSGSGSGPAGSGSGSGPAGSGPAGADSGAPSSCRPANHRGTIRPAEPSAGHRHYTVTLTAAPGYSPCTLAGAPTQVVFFSGGGGPLGVESRSSTQRGEAVTFGPGHPVHFDVQVPNSPGGARGARMTFTLRTPGGGFIPGDQDASGAVEVDAGTQIGPVQPGAS